mgnify:CR=1 FL=1
MLTAYCCGAREGEGGKAGSNGSVLTAARQPTNCRVWFPPTAHSVWSGLALSH